MVSPTIVISFDLPVSVGWLAAHQSILLSPLKFASGGPVYDLGPLIPGEEASQQYPAFDGFIVRTADEIGFDPSLFHVFQDQILVSRLSYWRR